MSDERSIIVSRDVSRWYAHQEPWRPQGKNIGWADYILIDNGALLESKDVLNLGCWYPEDEARFAPCCRWTAIDVVPEVIARAQAMVALDRSTSDPPPPGVADATFRLGDMRALDFAAASFDLVLDFSSGDHLTGPDYRQAVREVHRVLRPGGLFVCVFTNRLVMADFYESWPAGTTEEWGRFGYSRGDSPDEMRALLAAGGFVVDREANTHLPRSGFLARRVGQATSAGDGSGLA
jgi:SAM-dependent methyltransferase